MSIRELLESHSTFYTKAWQGNGFYPIDKYEWNESVGCYVRRAFKHKSPYPYGYLSSLEYILKNNPFLVSLGEFMDEKHYTNEGLELIKTK